VKLKPIKPKIDKVRLYRIAFNMVCNMLVERGYYKSTVSAEQTILRKIKKSWNQ
jgi:hypothetical protein